MVCQTSLLRPTRLRPLATARALAALSVLVVGAGFAASAFQAEPRQEPPPPKEVRKDEAGKADPGKKEEDRPKKSQADREIDELVEEMTRSVPPGVDVEEMRNRMRQQMAQMPAEQRKTMLEMYRRRKQGAFPGAGGPPGFPGGGLMPPGLGGQRVDARLGARVEPASATLAEQLELPKGQGLVIREVLLDSAASKAGLKPHDVLLEVNGKAVSNRVEELARLLATIKPDTAVEIVVLRKGKKEAIKDVKLPEAKVAPGGLPGFPPAVFPPGGVNGPPAGLNPPGGWNPFEAGGGSSVVTTMVRSPERLTLRHQEGSLIITLTGKIADGKATIQEIRIQDGGRPEQYESVDKVPDRYRDKVKNLIEMSEKGSVRIEIKSP